MVESPRSGFFRLDSFKALQPRAQPLQLFQQIQRQRGASDVDAEVLLQPLGAADAADADAVESPLSGLGAEGVDDALFDQLEDPLRGEPAGAAELGEGELDVFFEQVSGEQVEDFGLLHGSYPQVRARVEVERLLEGGIGGLG
jgi:hypothetical protein